MNQMLAHVGEQQTAGFMLVLARISRMSVERTTVAILPWLVPLLLALVAITYVPQITLWLPHLMGVMK